MFFACQSSQKLIAPLLTFLRSCDRMDAKITRSQHIKITIKYLHRYSEDTTDTPLSNFDIKNGNIFIKPFLIDFLILFVLIDTKKSREPPLLSVTHLPLSVLLFLSYLGNFCRERQTLSSPYYIPFINS